MNVPLFDRRSAERFAELLDETTGGRRHHGSGQTDERLAELVAIGHRLSAAPTGVSVDPEFRVGLRAMLVATAERDGIGATATAVETEPGAHAGVREPARSLFRLSGSARRVRARGAIVIGVAAGAMAVSGISAASENASPGDALYGVKRSTERAQLAMAGSDNTRGQLSLDFARTRLAEATAMHGDDPAFAGVLTDMDADTRKGVRLLTGSAVRRSETAPLGIVDGFVAQQRNTMESVLGKLSPTNKERALASVALLDRVRQRTEDLRDGLACATPAPAGTDALGPKLKDCGAGPDDRTSPSRPQRAGEKPARKSAGSADSDTTRPERTDPATAPDATGQEVSGKGEPAVPGTDSPTADPTPAETDQPDDDTGGVLPRILGGILGD